MTGPVVRSIPSHVRRFLDEAAATAFPAAALHDADLARAYLRHARARRPRPIALDPVAQIVETKVPGGPPLRLYVPDVTTPAPVLLYFHGGGWVLGDLDSNDPLCRRLANAAGVIVASVDYRLAPEHPHPAALDDAAAALSWARSEARRYGGDPSRVGVSGSSAGGNLAAALTLRIRGEGGRQPDIQLLIYPPLDSRCDSSSYRDNAEGFLLSGDQMRWFWRTYAPGHLQDPLVSPAHADTLSGLAPAYVMTAGYDPLCDEGRAYAERLRAAGVPVTLDHVENQIHGFANQVGLWPEADAAVARAAAAVRKALRAGQRA